MWPLAKAGASFGCSGCFNNSKFKGKGSGLPGNQLPLELATPKSGTVELNSNNQSFGLLLWVVVKEKLAL